MGIKIDFLLISAVEKLIIAPLLTSLLRSTHCRVEHPLWASMDLGSFYVANDAALQGPNRFLLARNVEFRMIKVNEPPS